MGRRAFVSANLPVWIEVDLDHGRVVSASIVNLEENLNVEDEPTVFADNFTDLLAGDDERRAATIAGKERLPEGRFHVDYPENLHVEGLKGQAARPEPYKPMTMRPTTRSRTSALAERAS